jgi:hypothetical protein
MFYETILTIVVLTNGAPSVDYFKVASESCLAVQSHYQTFMTNHNIKGFVYCNKESSI